MTQNNPKVSIILPTYNRAKMITRAINTALQQTFTDFELIIINDSSTDETEKIIQGFTDPRIKYLKHEQNKGGSASRNTGLKVARGKYIAFLDDDDEWFPEKIEKQVEKMESSPDIFVVDSGFEVWMDDQKIKRIYVPQKTDSPKKCLLLGKMAGGITIMVKKECFTKAGYFDEELKSGQDWDMWKRVGDHYPFDFIPDILTKVHLHKNNQISSNLENLIEGKRHILKKYESDFQQFPDIHMIHLKKLAKLYCLNGNWKDAFSLFAKIIKINILELFKIFAWLVIEYPVIKLSSWEKGFKKYKQ